MMMHTVSRESVWPVSHTAHGTVLVNEVWCLLQPLLRKNAKYNEDFFAKLHLPPGSSVLLRELKPAVVTVLEDS